jgi:hypothetical protein
MLFSVVIAALILAVRRKLNTLKMVTDRVFDGITLNCGSSKLISHSAPRG